MKNTIIKEPYAWRLILGEYEIRVKKIDFDEPSGLTIHTGDSHDTFKFENCDPATVKAIGELLQFASKL